MKRFWGAIFFIAAIISVFVFPWWLQIVFIGAAIVTMRPSALAIFPALLADLLYSDTTSLLWRHFFMTEITLVLLLGYFILETKTRLFHVYDFLEKEK